MRKVIAFIILLGLLTACVVDKNPGYMILFVAAAILFFLISKIFYGGAF